MAKTEEEIGAMMLGEQVDDTSEAEVVQHPDADTQRFEIVGEQEVEPVEETQAAEPELVEFDIDGQTYQAPQVVADAVMRNSEFTQKTQKLSEQRKQYEINIGQVQETQKAYEFAKTIQGDQLEIRQAEGLIAEYEQYFDTNVREMDPTAVAQVQNAIRQAERFIAQKKDDISTKQQEFQQAQEQSLRELLNKSTEVLRSKIPQWGESHQTEMKEYGLSLGFTEAEISSVVDPRQLEVLWKASQYDKLQKGKAAAVKTVQDAPTIQAKSRNPMSEETKDELKLRKALKSDKLTPAQKQALAAEKFGREWA